MKAQSFGYKNAWLAFRTEDAAAVARTLPLRDPHPADWATGVAAAYEYPIGCSVFVTPPIGGWVLCVGFPLFGPVDARPPTFGDLASGWATRLGCEVQYFSTHRIVEAHAWARARPDGLERAYLYVGESGEKVLDHGSPTSEEQELGFAFFDPASPEAESDNYWSQENLTYPDESHVMALAARWSLDPSTLDDSNSEVEMGLIGDYGEAPPKRDPTPAPQPRAWWKLW